METKDFDDVLKTHQNILRRRMDLPQYQLKTLETIVYIEDMDGLLCILQDVSKEEDRLAREYDKKLQMVGSAQAVIDKQMMVAQEIAGLLGETNSRDKDHFVKAWGSDPCRRWAGIVTIQPEPAIYCPGRGKGIPFEKKFVMKKAAVTGRFACNCSFCSF